MRRISRALPLPAVVVATLAVPAAAQATFPGRDGLIAFVAAQPDPGCSEAFGTCPAQYVNFVRPDGTGLRSLPNLKEAFGLSWSPDGRRLAFDRRSVISPAGRRLPALRLPGVTTIQSTSFMPRGGRSLVIGNTRGAPQGLLIAGGKLKRPRILRRSTLTQWTAVSPSGRYVAYDDSENNALVVRDLRTGRRRAIAEFPNSLDWSPDGRRLIYDGSNGVYSVRADGKDNRLIFPYDATAPFSYGEAGYSPSGRRIVFLRYGAGGASVVTSAPDGTDQRVVVDAATLDANGGGQPVWQPRPARRPR